jgi:hypothetical protein
MKSRVLLVSIPVALVLFLAAGNRGHGVHDFVGDEQRARAAKVVKVHVPQDEEEQRIFAFEATRSWGAAANAWKKRCEEFGRAQHRQPAIRQAYQKALFRYILCTHQFAVEMLKPQYTKRAANVIVQLEKSDEEMGGLKNQYQELLKTEPGLMAAYGELKAK